MLASRRFKVWDFRLFEVRFFGYVVVLSSNMRGTA